MRRKLRVFGVACVLMLLCATLLCGSLLGVQATATETNPLDFGIAGMESNQSVLPSVLFESILGEKPTAEEQAYLDGASGISFIYNSAIPDSVVQTEYNGDTGTLFVMLPPYTFTATNGTKVEWIPQCARVGDDEQVFSFANGEYTCRFEGLFHSGDFEIKVDFVWNATLPADAVDEILTKPYVAADAVLTELREYEAELAAYNAAKEKYLAYEAYLQSVAAYEQYTKVDLPAYDDAMAKYQPYRVATERFDADLAAYKEWQHYWDYVEFMTDDVQKAYAAYVAYLKQLEPIRARLKILDTLFVNDSHGWQLYASLMGGTVEQVVSRKNELIAYKKVFETHINNAEAATKELKSMMSQYAELRAAEYESEHARLTTLYGFYTQNYAALSAQFSKLFGALNYMGNDSAVIMALSGEGKLEHYYQFVGQLYITQICLNDSESLLNIYPICGQELNKVVEPLQFLTDGVSSPAGVTMPESEVPKVEKVEPIDPPTVPEIQYEPIFDDYLKAVLTEKPEWSAWKLSDWKTGGFPTAEPQKPAAVAKPSDTVPEAADDPGKAPAAPVIDARLRALAEALRVGRLPRREAKGQSHTYTLYESVTCPVSIHNLKTVTFYAADSKTLLHSISVEYGTLFKDIEPVVPDRDDDAQFVYGHGSWVLVGTLNEKPTEVLTNLSLYAVYETNPRFYGVTWILDGVTEKRNVKYGDVPVCPFITQKNSDVQYTYTFSGWDKEVAPVTGDVTYTGSFIRTPRTYTVTWVVDGRSESEVLPYGSIPQYTGDTAKSPDIHRYTFAGWDKPITTLVADVTYTARYLETPLALDASGTPLEATHSEDALTVTVTGKRADIREAARLALEEGKVLVLCWEQFSLTLKSDALDALINSYSTSVGITKTETDESGTSYTVGYLNSAGKLLDIQISATLQTLANDSGGQLAGYLHTDGGWTRMEDGGVLVTGSVSFRIGNVYGLNVVSKEPCNLSRFPRFFEADATVDLSLIGCVFGYEITSATLIMADGSRVAVEGMTFTMPKGDAQIELTVQKIVYRVSFVVDGKVIHTAEYGLGEEIVAPEGTPEKPTDEQYSYTFTGWSSDVGIAFGDERDLVFEAVFSATSIGNPNFVPDRSLFIKAVTIAVCIFVLLVGGITLTVILIRRKKKNAKGLSRKAKPTSAKIKAVSAKEPLRNEQATEALKASEATEATEATEEIQKPETVDQP